MQNREVVRRALDRYAAANLDFGDAMIAAAMHPAGSDSLYSFDADVDRLPNVRRREPPRSGN